MIKKFLLTLAALLPFIASGQSVGSWMQYPLFNGRPTTVIATPSQVYYLSLGILYGYNPTSEESYEYIEIINGKSVSFAEYNAAGKFIVLGYSDGNIDLLYDNDKVVNLSDIRDASMRGDKIINDVDFNGNKMAVATSFGVVLFDIDKKSVIKSGIYDKNISSIAVTDNYLVINDGEATYAASINDQINRFDKFQKISSGKVNKIMNLNGSKNRIVIVDNNRELKIYDVASTSSLTPVTMSTTITDLQTVSPSSNGLYVHAAAQLYLINKDGEITAYGYLPSEVNSGIVATCKGLSEIWTAKDTGLTLYDASSSNLTVKASDVKPAGSVGVQRVNFIIPSRDGKRIYVSNVGNSWGVGAIGASVEQSTYIIEGDKVRDVSSLSPIIKNPGMIVEDPDNPARYFMAANSTRLVTVTDRKGLVLNTTNNIPRAERFTGMNIDQEGNLWVTIMDGKRTNAIYMLPSAIRKKEASEYTAADWKDCKITGFQGQYDGLMYDCRKSPIVIIGEAHTADGIVFIHTNGTLGDISDDRFVMINNFIDQDGKSYDVKDLRAVAEEEDGSVWFVTANGIFTMSDPTKALDNSFTVNRVKVPRNDGTGFADYLLDGENCNGISIDANNNKWISTTSSGVYQVSPKGDVILQNFNNSNSILPSTLTLSVYADKLTNRVFVGTNNGLYYYYNSASASYPDYSEVFAFPNPVKPGYTGWITVTNLMDNSLVKIMDASGQLIYQGRSEGGMFTWDGCNSDGRRVPSGVYYVFASQSSNDSSSGAVTKILIMN